MLAPPTENAEFREDSQHAIVDGIPGTILQFGGGRSAIMGSLLGVYQAHERFTVQYYASGDTRRAAADEFAELAKAHNFSPVAIVFPMFPGDGSLQHYEYFQEHERTRSFFAGRAVPVLDLYDVCLRCRAQNNAPIHQDYLHSNTLGSKCIGEAVAEYLVRRLRPEPPSNSAVRIPVADD